MSEDDSDQESKTEDPSGKKLSDAKKKGQQPVSQEVKNFFVMLGAMGVLLFVIKPATMSLIDTMTLFLDHAGTMPFDSKTLSNVLSKSVIGFLVVLLAPLGVLALSAIVGSVIQTRSIWSPEALTINFSKLSPMKGWKRLFSIQSVIEMGKSIIKMLIIGGLLIHLIKPSLENIENYVTMEPADMGREMLGFAVQLLSAVTMAVALMAALDYTYQYFSFIKKMRMTKQEVKDEYKQSEGDPLIKGKIRQLRMQKARQRMMANVPNADVIITNPTHYAIALKYDQGNMQAPVCLAKGVDDVAKRIREIADEHNIPRVSNPVLARSLYASAEIDQEIPVEHYKAVAEVISFVFRLRGKKGKK